MDVNAAVAAGSALVGACTGVVAMLSFRWSEREQTRPIRTTPYPDAVLPPGVDTVLSVLRSSAVVLDESDLVVKASSAAYALGLVRGGRLAVDQMLQMARETRRDGEIRQVELDLPRRGGRGEPLAVSARVAPLGSRLVLLLVEDLTEARRIEAVRRDFVANVSHELKTPVGALALLSEAVSDASDDPEAVVRFAGRMQSEATRLTSLVQEIIDLSRVQNDDPLEDAEAVAVEELVAEAVDRCRHPANAKQITMSTSGAPGLYVWGHRGQLAAALGNLVENAVNYSPARTRVGISARRIGVSGGGLIELAVTDQGSGISPADRERIFERFYRVDPARSRATGGTGLGLSIVKHVAASHGGEVTVWSAEGQGSTFTLKLPEAAGSQPSSGDQHAAGEPAAADPGARDPGAAGPGAGDPGAADSAGDAVASGRPAIGQGVPERAAPDRPAGASTADARSADARPADTGPSDARPPADPLPVREAAGAGEPLSALPDSRPADSRVPDPPLSDPAPGALPEAAARTGAVPQPPSAVPAAPLAGVSSGTGRTPGPALTRPDTVTPHGEARRALCAAAPIRHFSPEALP